MSAMGMGSEHEESAAEAYRLPGELVARMMARPGPPTRNLERVEAWVEVNRPDETD